MLTSFLPCRSVLFGLAACLVASLLGTGSASADSLSLLTDLEYEITDTTTTEKATGSSHENDRTTFSQLYSLEVQKEFMPNLKLNFGGLFDQDDISNTTTDPEARDSDMANTTIRPYIDLQLNSQLLRAMAGYRKSEIKRSGSTLDTTRNFSEEYNTRLSWDPVEWPEVDLDFTRNLTYDSPRTNDQRSDNYQLRSRYRLENFRFTYHHTTTDTLNKITDSETLTHFDNGAVRFNRTYGQEKITVNSSLRARRQETEFSGPGDRLVPTSSAGRIIGRTEDPFPLTSDPEDDFSLGEIDLLVDSPLEAQQFSSGLDFGTPTDVDTLFIRLEGLDDISTPGIDSGSFSWNIYVRDNETDDWTQVSPLQDNTDFVEDRFELSFSSLKTRYIKIVTTPLAPPEILSSETLMVSDLAAQRTLPPDTSEFITTDWTADAVVNWKHTEKTSTGYNFLYREQRSKPLDEKKTRLDVGARVSHLFNDVFAGNMRLQRSENRERDDGSRTDYMYSASLAAKYLETFDQNLTYSHTRQRDEDDNTGTSNTVFLRNNLHLYEGWSMFIDSGYSWQDPAEGEDSNTTFLRMGSNIIPNSKLNLNLTYGVSWNRQTGRPVSRDQDGRVVVSWVPTSTLSLSADLIYSEETGREKDSIFRQQYFVNWSPLRGGTLDFSVTYGRTDDSDEEKTWNISPTLRWQANRKSLVTLDYNRGEREDLREIVAFENISLGLRFLF